MKLPKILLYIILLSFSISAFGQSAELKKRKAALTREIEALKKEQNKIAGNKRLSIKQIDALNTQIQLREEKISTINSEIRLLEREIRTKSDTVHSLQGQLNVLKRDYVAMLRFAYKNQNAHNKLMFIFASESFNQAYKRLKYLQQFSEQIKRQTYKISGTKKLLKGKISELDEDRRSKSSLLQSEEAEKVTLSKEKNNEAEQLEKFNKDEKQIKQQVDARKKELVRLNRAISDAIAKELEAERKRLKEEAAKLAAVKAEKARLAEKARIAEAKKNVDTKKTTSSKTALPVKEISPKESPVIVSSPISTANVKLSADFSNNHGRLPWPATGSIVSKFGMNKYGTVLLQNNGIDIRTGGGAAVASVFSGEVRRVLSDISGYILLIKHGNYFSVYSNLRSVNVSAGQSVSAGQVVGAVKTNIDDGISQLHFEIWKGTKPTNPEDWLRR